MAIFMANSVIPNFLMKASNFLNGTSQTASTTANTVSSNQSIFTDSASSNVTENRTKDSYNTFDFKFDSVYGDSQISGERRQCKEAYDKWVKSDDYTATTNAYATLTQKQNTCNSTLNKVKNFFGRGQTWSANDQNQYDNLMSHIDIMTTRGGVGQ